MNIDANIDGFSQRLLAVIGEDSPHAFAKKCEMGDSSLRPYLKGSFPRMDKLITMAQVGNVNLEWLATGKGPMRPGDKHVFDEVEGISHEDYRGLPEDNEAEHPDEDTEHVQQPHTHIPQWEHPDPDMFHYVPMAKTKLSAGGGSFVLSEDISDYYAFRKIWLNRVASSPKHVVLMGVQGNSMSPTILDKDTVMIDTGRMEIIEGMIYAIRIDHTIMLKRLTHRPGGIVNVISDNKEEFETYQAKRKDIHIIGQIIFFNRDLISGT
ncbi:MAG: helix-turn-helix domain-containing protein [Proteobacteria bacterium]|nr:helix-turn-helix domain-containing protein [Pseudomonadota bacterium]MBU1057090.1 helix-turn-helix domain-containing protein [Pseudomonadota bacterium]